ncbi:signal peptidase I [Nocardioides sp.]|uniref:signal peptidase I n=1 Tax=Nocardioides sp. TaxID=35761 RepID=UPI00286AEA64|nr:signal peptidase I [Nocardioides sp.]
MSPRLARGVRELVLTVGALLGSLGLLVVLGGLVLDVRPLVFRSGSMAPAIDTGALALVRSVPAADLRVGDVVSVVDTGGTRVTHRVVSLSSQGEQRQLTLRGDANRSADREVHTVSEADRLIASVPWLGYVIGWMSGRLGTLLLGVYGAFLASVLLRGRADSPPSPPRPPPTRARRRAAPASAGRHASRVLAMAVVGAAALLPSPVSAAPWTDGVVVSGTGLAAHTVAAPDSTTCSISSPSATITWPEKSSLYDYEVVLRRADNSVVSTRQVTGSAVSTTYTATADFGFGGLALGTYDFKVEIRSYLSSATSWRGSGTLLANQQIRISVVLVLVPVLGSISCV